MKIIDITRGLQRAPIYPGSNPVSVERLFDMERGDAYNSSVVTAGSHMGTHADAYCHFLADSDVGIGEMELWRYYGACRVVETPRDALIEQSFIEPLLENCERLVLKTGGNSYFTEAAAGIVAARGIALVVTDALSVAPLDNEKAVHEILLRAGVAIVENAALEHVAPGDYTICAFPTKIDGCDGAPVRAVLLAE